MSPDPKMNQSIQSAQKAGPLSGGQIAVDGKLRPDSRGLPGELPKGPQPSRIGRLVRALKGAILHAWTELTADRRWFLCTAGFVLVWSVELFAMQGRTLISPQDISLRLAIAGPL